VKIALRAFRILAVLWAGSLWSMLWTAAVMFQFQNDKHVAGLIAARLFSIETYLGFAVGAFALMLPLRARFGWGYVALGLLAFNEWVLKAVMSAAKTQGSAFGLGFGPWHGVSALLYSIACMSVVVLVWKEDLRQLGAAPVENPNVADTLDDFTGGLLG
jgi:hypothetical protein